MRQLTHQAPAVPGLRLRPFAGEPDLADIARIGNAEAEADQILRRVTVEELAVHYGHPNAHFDAARDITIAEVDGRPVAYGEREWIDTTDGLREYRMDGAVDPELRGRGIGATLLADNARRQRELAATHDSPLLRVFGSWSADTQQRDARLLTAAGFEPARWFFDMTRPDLDDVPDVRLPEGLELRPVTRDTALEVWRADVEAFRDHWGGFDGSDDRLDEWLARPTTDLSMWVIAYDGDEVAGGVLNTIDMDENAALGIRRGWLSSVFTRRRWRRRGVAKALIARSLALHRERGMTSASLGVDADNPSGALGLYEGAGFQVDYRSTAWRKPF
ncbi:MAG TPA: GNAT family N-acetyltransferase [Candidatus Dormibacteraeota bacterium]|nr:GNAT family N-acetyltransferase [Candidatus Dormibacteraeota bacterium]